MALKDTAFKDKAESHKRKTAGGDEGRQEKRKKSTGFFDLGIFVEKVRAREIDILDGETTDKHMHEVSYHKC